MSLIPRLDPPTEQDLEDAYRNIPQSARSGTIDKPKGSFDPTIPDILPHEQVFQIQVGERLFKLSGASLSSDAPSYFTTFFLKHKNLSLSPDVAPPILYIDRSPKVFDLIVAHLQGYYIMPDNDVDFVYLLLDANYFHLPRLIHQLATAEIFVRIGFQSFRIPRNIFSGPGDSPNFFSLGFSTFFGSEISPPSKTFKRPPPVAPPSVPHRSGDLFHDLLLALQGRMLDIRDDEHRMLLLTECRYYRFLGLEQKLIAHSLNTNRIRQTEEIVIGLNDVRPKNLVFKEVSPLLIPKSSVDLVNNTPALLQLLQRAIVDMQTAPKPKMASLFYKRPYVDTKERELVLDVKDSPQGFSEPVGLFRSANTGQWEAVFYDKAQMKMRTLIDVVIATTNQKRAVTTSTSATASSADNGGTTPTSTKSSSNSPILDHTSPANSTNTFSIKKEDGTTYPINLTDDFLPGMPAPLQTPRGPTTPTAAASSPMGPYLFLPQTPRGGYFVCMDNAHVVLNGKVIDPTSKITSTTPQPETDSQQPRKRARVNSDGSGIPAAAAAAAVPGSPASLNAVQMILTKSQWRVINIDNIIMLELLRAEGRCGQRYVNATRDFL